MQLQRLGNLNPTGSRSQNHPISHTSLAQLLHAFFNTALIQLELFNNGPDGMSGCKLEHAVLVSPRRDDGADDAHAADDNGHDRNDQVGPLGGEWVDGALWLHDSEVSIAKCRAMPSASARFPSLPENTTTSTPALVKNWTAIWPSPPNPMIPTRSVGRTYVCRISKTVAPPHMSGAACSGATPAGTLKRNDSSQTACDPNEPWSAARLVGESPPDDVANGERNHAFTDLLDDADAFMAQHHVSVFAALDTRMSGADEHLAALGRLERGRRLDDFATGRPFEHGGFDGHCDTVMQPEEGCWNCASLLAPWRSLYDDDLSTSDTAKQFKPGHSRIVFPSAGLNLRRSDGLSGSPQLHVI
uniref:Uncharacterized protein n=1 Tax=Mycena chlorophos TaxID=658473 RepID=A0ABQ0KZU9_MYCCL|nr:predicted protein [Mycena chlorophos]